MQAATLDARNRGDQVTSKIVHWSDETVMSLFDVTVFEWTVGTRLARLQVIAA